jgi:hypothetical protein
MYDSENMCRKKLDTPSIYRDFTAHVLFKKFKLKENFTEPSIFWLD